MFVPFWVAVITIGFVGFIVGFIAGLLVEP
jgi:hypothetical protein